MAANSDLSHGVGAAEDREPRSPLPVLRRVLIKNYRVFRDFRLEFSPGINIIVGNNDAGKSTLLEAINLALTARLHGYPSGPGYRRTCSTRTLPSSMYAIFKAASGPRRPRS
jgi:predicted ATPase